MWSGCRLAFGMHGNRDLGRPVFSHVLDESRFDFCPESLRDGSFPFQAYFGEDDSQDGALPIPTNQIRLTFGRNNNINGFFQNSFCRAIFQIRVQEH
jgi:hypothetical protein